MFTVFIQLHIMFANITSINSWEIVRYLWKQEFHDDTHVINYLQILHKYTLYVHSVYAFLSITMVLAYLGERNASGDTNKENKVVGNLSSYIIVTRINTAFMRTILIHLRQRGSLSFSYQRVKMKLNFKYIRCFSIYEI